MLSLWGFTTKRDDKKSKPAASGWPAIPQVPQHTLALGAFAAGVTATLSTRAVYLRFFKRIPNGDWITPDVLRKRKWLKGRVVRYVQRSSVPRIGLHRTLKYEPLLVSVMRTTSGYITHRGSGGGGL